MVLLFTGEGKEVGNLRYQKFLKDRTRKKDRLRDKREIVKKIDSRYKTTDDLKIKDLSGKKINR